MTPLPLNAFLQGFLCMGQLVIALFFARFLRKTRDRLFLLFALAFLILSLTQVGFLVIGFSSERSVFVYLARLCAYALIFVAIVDKNRR